MEGHWLDGGLVSTVVSGKFRNKPFHAAGICCGSNLSLV